MSLTLSATIPPMPEWIINLDDDDLLEDLRDQLEEPERFNDYFSPTLDDDPTPSSREWAKKDRVGKRRRTRKRKWNIYGFLKRICLR